MAPEYGHAGSPSADVAVVEAIYAAFERRDVEAVLEYVAEDVELKPVGTSSRIGRTEPYRGHQGLRDYFEDVGRVWDDLTLHATDIRSAAGSVVVFGHATGSVGGEPVSRRAVWVWRFRDGKAVSLHVHEVGNAG